MKVFEGQREIPLGPRLGAGADGAVYRVKGNNDSCIKIFDPAARSRLMQRLPRIRQLVQLAPHLGGNAAVPTYLISEQPNGNPIGFGMKRIEGSEVHNLYGVSSRQHHFPGTDFRFLVQAAKNVAVATARLHQHKVVIGDISGRNLMVRKDATVCWIDADSFLLGAAGFHEVCPLVTPEWTAPELQQDRHRSTVRLPGHDAFGLAVMIFHILMLGRHPFQGRFTGAGEAPGIPENIGNRWYAHAGYAAIPLKSPVGTPPVAHLGPAIEQLFLKAFLEVRPERRPSAEDWVQALVRLEGSMRKCPGYTSHFFSSAALKCPWCQVLPDYGQVDPFQGVPMATGSGAASGFGAGMGPLDAEIASFMVSLAPPASIPNAVYRPNPATVGATWTYQKPGWVASLLSSPRSELAKLRLFKSGFEQMVAASEAEMVGNLNAQQGWLSQVAEVARKISQLQGEAARVLAGQALRSEAKKDLDGVLDQQERTRYVARFRIVAGQVAGIGEKRVAELAGHGITTAADIVSQRILGIPGFGEALTKALVAWRREMEKGFRPNPGNVSINRIDHRARELFVERKAGYLRRREDLVLELNRSIQFATHCAGLAVTIQAKLDGARANVAAVEKAMRALA